MKSRGGLARRAADGYGVRSVLRPWLAPWSAHGSSRPHVVAPYTGRAMPDVGMQQSRGRCLVRADLDRVRLAFKSVRVVRVVGLREFELAENQPKVRAEVHGLRQADQARS